MPENSAPALGAGAAARRLGIAPETLRSWDRRYGLGPREHQAGAHRRYTPADMARLESVCRLVAEGVPVAEAAVAVLADDTGPAVAREAVGREAVAREAVAQATVAREAVAQATVAPGEPSRASAGGGHTLPIGRHSASTARGLARCAIRLDAPRILDLLEAAFARDGVAAVWQHTIEPALRAVGRKWTETHGRYVEVEHLLSWCVATALHRTLPPRPAAGWSRGRGVLLACAAGEWHGLPLEVLNAALAERGTPVRMLGQAVPGAALLEAARRTWPAHVVVWSHVSGTADMATLAQLSRQQPRTQVIAAGGGWTGRIPPGIAIVNSLEQALDACDRPRAPATEPDFPQHG